MVRAHINSMRKKAELANERQSRIWLVVDNVINMGGGRTLANQRGDRSCSTPMLNAFSTVLQDCWLTRFPVQANQSFYSSGVGLLLLRCVEAVKDKGWRWSMPSGIRHTFYFREMLTSRRPTLLQNGLVPIHWPRKDGRLGLIWTRILESDTSFDCVRTPPRRRRSELRGMVKVERSSTLSLLTQSSDRMHDSACGSRAEWRIGSSRHRSHSSVVAAPGREDSIKHSFMLFDD